MSREIRPPTYRSVRELISMVERGEICAPRGIQRGFVWTYPKVIELVESLYRRYPIGIITLVELGEEGRSIATEIIRPIRGDVIPRYIVIDGLQRLASLVLIKRGEAEVIGRGMHYEQKVLKLCFNIDSESFEIRNPDSEWIRVSEVLSSNTQLLKFIRSLPEDKAEKLLRLSKILDIEIPICELGKETSIDDIITIFDRINRAGTGRVETAQLVMAYIYSIDRELAEEIYTYMEDLKSRRWRLDLKTPLTVLSYKISNSAYLDSLKRYIVEKTRCGKQSSLRDDLRKEWIETKRAVNNAIELLESELRVKGDKHLPSESALRTLAITCSLLDDRIMISKKLSYWFVLACVLRRYTGGTEFKITEDANVFRNALSEGKDRAISALIESIKRQRGQILLTESDFTHNDRFTRLLLYLALVENNAKDPETGVKIESLSVSDWHHLFSRSALRGCYSRELINDIANITILHRETNRSLQRYPELGDYLKKMRSEQKEVFEEFLRGHFIPQEEELWYKDKFRDFLTKRKEMILNFINNRVSSLFP